MRNKQAGEGNINEGNNLVKKEYNGGLKYAHKLLQPATPANLAITHISEREILILFSVWSIDLILPNLVTIRKSLYVLSANFHSNLVICYIKCLKRLKTILRFLCWF